jgi:NTP pyrophosphatase (non-canonical NTP hydrolase)
MPGSKTTPLAIGSDTWPGLSKLTEESGEMTQVVGKIIAFPDTDHPDGKGKLPDRLCEELADLSAAILYVVMANDRISNEDFASRRVMKLERFIRWHEEEQGVGLPV